MRCASRRSGALAVLNWDLPANLQHRFAPGILAREVVPRLDRLRQRIHVFDGHDDTDVVNKVSDLPQEFRAWLQDDVHRADATLGCLRGIGGIDRRLTL